MLTTSKYRLFYVYLVFIKQFGGCYDICIDNKMKLSMLLLKNLVYINIILTFLSRVDFNAYSTDLH